jgi:hypothetical protein
MSLFTCQKTGKILQRSRNSGQKSLLPLFDAMLIVTVQVSTHMTQTRMRKHVTAWKISKPSEFAQAVCAINQSQHNRLRNYLFAHAGSFRVWVPFGRGERGGRLGPPEHRHYDVWNISCTATP